jgi:hypothetical protein
MKGSEMIRGVVPDESSSLKAKLSQTSDQQFLIWGEQRKVPACGE